MMRVRFPGIILALAASGAAFGACVATAALAQVRQEQPTSALKGHNSDAPVDVTADRIEVQDRADRAIFAGNVHVTQAELTLDTPRLTVAYSGGAGGSGVQIKRLDAAGGVTVKSPSETARGGSSKRLGSGRRLPHTHALSERSTYPMQGASALRG